MPISQGVLLEYQARLQALQASLSQAHAKQSGALALLWVLLAIFLLLCLAVYSSKRAVPVWLPPLVAPLAALTWRNLLQNRRKTLKALRLQRFYQSGVDRLEGNWAGRGASGDEFGRADHLYERDLNLFGAGSMFELLCTTRSRVGQRRLASYLLDVPDRDETLARQEAVKELAPHSDLRERICLLGNYTFQSCDWEPFGEWLDSTVITVAGAFRWILPTVSCALALLVLIPWLAPSGAGLWTRAAPLILSSAAVQIGLAFLLRGRVRPVLDRNRNIGHEIAAGARIAGGSILPLSQVEGNGRTRKRWERCGA
jgi:hypothetical protein